MNTSRHKYVIICYICTVCKPLSRSAARCQHCRSPNTLVPGAKFTKLCKLVNSPTRSPINCTWITCKCAWKSSRENYIHFGPDEKYNNGYNLKSEFLFYSAEYKIIYACSYNLLYKDIIILILNDIYVLIINNWIMKTYALHKLFWHFLHTILFIHDIPICEK